MKIDFRLFDISQELYALEHHYGLIEKQILHLTDAEKKATDDYRKKEKLNPDDAEWDISSQELDYKIEFLLPRIFGGPFIVSLYAVFETSVMEIANLMQKTMKQGIGINDLKGDFLERAKKYYENVLNFKLYCNNNDWQDIKSLTNVRHAIAHANGRIDMLNEKIKKKIKELEKQDLGVSLNYNYILVNSHFSKKVFSAVKSTLEDLVVRYKEWNTKQKSV